MKISRKELIAALRVAAVSYLGLGHDAQSDKLKDLAKKLEEGESLELVDG